MEAIFKGTINKQEDFWKVEILELNYCHQNESLVTCLNELRTFLLTSYDHQQADCSVVFSDGGIFQVKVLHKT